MNSKVGIGIGAAVGLVAIGGLLYFAIAPVEDAEFKRSERAETAEKTVKPRKALASAKTSGSKERTKAVREKGKARPRMQMPEDSGKRNAKPRMVPMRDWFEDLPSGKDRDIAKRIQGALDDNDLDATRAAAMKAQSSSSPEVRQHAVEALGWFGKDALVELTPFLHDQDPEVAQAAFDAWDSAVDMMEDEAGRVKIAGMAMKTLTNKDSLSCVAAKLYAAENQKASVDAIIDVIQHGNEQSAQVAKETYESITGEEWKGPAAARIKAILLDHVDKSND